MYGRKPPDIFGCYKANLKYTMLYGRCDMKNLNELSKLLCHYEKGNSQVNIAQMKEIVTKLSILMYENPEVMGMLLKLAKKKKGL